MVDVLSAIGELQIVTGRWLADLEEHRLLSEEAATSLQLRYQTAKQRLDNMAVVGSVILPERISAGLSDLRSALEGDYETWFDDLWASQTALDAARDLLVSFGRSRMR